MNSYIKHVTTEGERWDLLADHYYGDARGYERILEANPEVPMMSVLPAGIVLQIPVIEQREINDPEALPPWMR